MVKLAILNTHPIQYFAPMYRKLAMEKNIDLTVLYCSRWGLDEYTDPQFNTKFKWDIPLLDGYKYKFLKNFRNKENVNKFFNLVNLEIISELIKNRYDVLWLNGHNNLTNIIAVITAKLTGIALFMRAETQLNREIPGFKKALRKPVMKLFYKLFDGFLYIGTRNREYYEYLGIPDKKLFLVPYTVDNKFFTEKIKQAGERKAEIKNKFNINNESLNILFASKFLERKKPMDLLLAFQKLKQKLNNINLLFAGSGEEEEKMKKYADENNLTGVYFLGFLNQSQLPDAFAIADVFVLPSVNEQWGLIINEAMCAGLPVIASDVIGAVPDLVKNGINGYTFKPGNIDELAEKLYLILSNPGLRASMGNKSREIIERWSYNECIAGIQKALLTVVN